MAFERPLLTILPGIGQTSDMEQLNRQDDLAVDRRDTPFDDLLGQLERTTTLTRGEAIRVVSEIVAFFSETLEIFVPRRHRELQSQGRSNAEIYEQLLDELRFVRLAAPSLTVRQIRRLIYH